jgi:hypothetical protein
MAAPLLVQTVVGAVQINVCRSSGRGLFTLANFAGVCALSQASSPTNAGSP